MLHRFILAAGCFQGNTVRFPPEASRQIRQVLRLRPGQRVVAVDPGGWDHEVSLSLVTAEGVTGVIQSSRLAEADPLLKLALYISLTQREKFEWALQKCTEVGVSLFYPVISTRTLAREKDEALQKMDRWRRIIREAAEQSGRAAVPEISSPLLFQEALDLVPPVGYPRALLWEGEREISLQAWLDAGRVGSAVPHAAVGIFVGPEGGYSVEEAEKARRAGVAPVSLGRRILRMETAAVVASALVMNAGGELGYGDRTHSSSAGGAPSP